MDCRGNVGDHIALLNVYNGWSDEDVNYSTQWCFQNFVQVCLLPSHCMCSSAIPWPLLQTGARGVPAVEPCT